MPETQGFLHNCLTFFFWWCFFGALVWWIGEITGMTRINYLARVKAGKPVSLARMCGGTVLAILGFPFIVWHLARKPKSTARIMARNLWGRG